MQSAEIRQKFLDFFEKRGHTIVPSSPLVTDDPSVLFTTAGMQQFKPYYLGKPSPYGNDVASVQKCIRTSDIEEVGDERHLTFFEMLGNFSFGGYWKEEAIKYAHEFVTQELRLKIDYVTIFAGEEGVPRDDESERIWRALDGDIVIKAFGREDNFWGPTGEEGPCGPTTEIYVNGIEIWNIVFNEYYQNKDKSLKSLEIRGIDTGMGLERLVMVVQNVPTVFDTDIFGGKATKEERVIADHSRAVAALIYDGVVPSNKDHGYILRRLIRRGLLYSKKSGIPFEIDSEVFADEKQKFEETLESGLKQWEKGVDPFVLYTTFGFPLELTRELAQEKGIKIDEKDFEERFKEHQELSKIGSEQKFKGGLAGHSEIEIRYHTATHLLHQALRDVLGDGVMQKGSNITPERLRFDFAFPRKMTAEEKQRVEEIVNKKINEALPVSNKIMNKDEALESGALHFFDQKYPDQVSVYSIGEYSKEFCGGPHVSNTKEIGIFKIMKEEAVSLGVRRIKAVLQ